MGKFDLYKIQLKSLLEENYSFQYELNNDFFEKIDSPEVQKGSVTAIVTLSKKANTFELNFVLEGVVIVACDRCLDEMEQPINYRGKMIVKFGKEFSQEDDDIVIVPEAEGEINIAWFLYEFIVLSIPAKCIHAPGKCNKIMASKLRKHLVLDHDDDENENFDEVDLTGEDNETTVDPRWDGLRNIINN
ncbi:MAG: DUF177 domain-containing protein [Prevotellaceae bacterium]|nr:DUF177 domain-containing protein [Prevotellaceae bacterium]